MRYPVSDAGSHLSGGKFTDGNPTTGAASSVDKAAHMNAVYDELIAFIGALGGAPVEGNNTQIATLFTPYVANAISTAIAGVRNGVSGALDTLQEIATALGGKSDNGHAHTWASVTGKPALSDATDQANSNQIATSAAVNALRFALSLAIGSRAGLITGTWDNFYIPDINIRVKTGYASLTSAAGAGMYFGTVPFPVAFPNNCFVVLPILSSLEDITLDFYATLSCHLIGNPGFFWKLRKLTGGGAWSCTYIAIGN